MEHAVSFYSTMQLKSTLRLQEIINEAIWHDCIKSSFSLTREQVNYLQGRISESTSSLELKYSTWTNIRTFFDNLRSYLVIIQLETTIWITVASQGSYSKRYKPMLDSVFLETLIRRRRVQSNYMIIHSFNGIYRSQWISFKYWKAATIWSTLLKTS